MQALELVTDRRLQAGSASPPWESALQLPCIGVPTQPQPHSTLSGCAGNHDGGLLEYVSSQDKHGYTYVHEALLHPVAKRSLGPWVDALGLRQLDHLPRATIWCANHAWPVTSHARSRVACFHVAPAPFLP